MKLSRQTEAGKELTEQPNQQGLTLAKALAPEELRTGEYVTLLHEIAELPSFYWCRDNSLVAPEEVVRIRYLPTNGGTPLKVKSICLPFVLVKHPSGEKRSIDLRKCRVARLSVQYSEQAWKACKKARPSARRRT